MKLGVLGGCFVVVWCRWEGKGVGGVEANGFAWEHVELNVVVVKERFEVIGSGGVYEACSLCAIDVF